MKRDYDSSPVADSLGLRDVIIGLANDLTALRNHEITPADANARAAVAKQVFNGVRLYLTSVKVLEAAARKVPDAPRLKGTDQ